MQENGTNPILAEGVGDPERADSGAEGRRQLALLKAGALQNAILTSANFSIIATDEKGIIQLFNVGAERMLGYTAAEVVNKINPERHPRSAGSCGARAGVEPGACHADCAGLRGAGLQGFARDRGHLRI